MKFSASQIQFLMTKMKISDIDAFNAEASSFVPVISEKYTRNIDEKIEKIEFERSSCEDLVYIKCEKSMVTFGGISFSNGYGEDFWNELIEDEIKTITWCKYKNDSNKYVKLNNKEFVIDDEWYLTCEQASDSEDEEDEE